MSAFMCGACGLRTTAFLPSVPRGLCLSKRWHAPSAARRVWSRRVRRGPLLQPPPRRVPAAMTTAPDDMIGKAAAAAAASDAAAADGLSAAPGVGGSGGAEAGASATRAAARARFKVQRRVATGVVMGVVVIAFVFSGRWPFLAGMLLLSLLGQAEYYRMVAAKGHLPALKMGLCATAATMVTSALSPALADAAFPLGGTLICIYLLFRRRRIATIADISTTFMGLFYAGYLPSFWIRLHEYSGGGTVPALFARALHSAWPSFLHFQPVVTAGSLLVFWTWLAGASADIGAFFIGRTYGRTRFSNISPKKTVEGAVAGFCCSASVSLLGAFLLKWPLWWVTGAVYGISVGVVGLFGDLFESCLKRDVGWKDSGSLFPGHGGILDRADSYVLIAPLVYFFATLVLPMIAGLVA